jgi:hypothetical protein
VQVRLCEAERQSATPARRDRLLGVVRTSDGVKRSFGHLRLCSDGRPAYRMQPNGVWR